MKCSKILTSAAVLAACSLVVAASCSGDEAGNEQQGMDPLQGSGGSSGAESVGSSGSGNAGAAGTGTPATGNGGGGGAAPEGQGGSVPIAGSASTGSGSSGSAGAAGTGGGQAGAGQLPPGTPPACMTEESPSDGESCTETCTDLCGVHNLGSRVCTCGPDIECDEGNAAPCMDCAGCGFTINHPVLEPPAGPLDDCAAVDDIMEGNDDANPPPACTDNERCQSIRPDDGAERFCACLGGEWDCDSKPMNFP